MLTLAAVIAMSAPARALEIPHERYQLDNGLNVILHHDSSLPQVVINLWYDVGSKDEESGRSGFAHLFEHLMFMGTVRLPDAGFDDRMEAYGGWNNAWTSEDATDYYDVGPSNLTPTLLWMEADRLDGLAKAMTQEKLDLQREVVRNERRQGSEDAPYGELWLVLPEAMYPQGHPYAHPVIGSHEDLAAATLQDVIDFFETWYVPNNASLVVAGDFDPTAIRTTVEDLFGGLQGKPTPPRIAHQQVVAPVESLVELTDQVQIDLVTLTWHTPAVYAPGDAEMDLVADLLSDGRSSRLYRRLVETGIALEVDATQMSQKLSSLFMISAKPADGHTVEELETIILEEIATLSADGPTDQEMERALNKIEMDFVQGIESLQGRASALNRYQQTQGISDFIEQDLQRYKNATREGVIEGASRLAPDQACTIRIRAAADTSP